MWSSWFWAAHARLRDLDLRLALLLARRVEERRRSDSVASVFSSSR
jgi:hypothetical protein